MVVAANSGLGEAVTLPAQDILFIFHILGFHFLGGVFLGEVILSSPPGYFLFVSPRWGLPIVQEAFSLRGNSCCAFLKVCLCFCPLPIRKLRTALRFPCADCQPSCSPSVVVDVQESDLEVVVSAVRLVYHTLTVTPPAAAAVAVSGPRREFPATGVSADATPVAGGDDGGGGGGQGRMRGGGVDRRLGLEALPPEAAPGKGKGKKRGRDEIGGEDSRGSESDEDGGGGPDSSGGGDDAVADAGADANADANADGRKGRSSSPPPVAECSLFIAGQPVGAGDVHATLESVVCSKATTPATRSGDGKEAFFGGMEVGRERGAGDRDGGWAGRRRAEDLGRRVKGGLVALFHRGAMCGCSALVEACLQVSRAAAVGCFC